MALQGKLSHPKRYITTHNDEGLAIVDTSVAAEAPFYELAPKDAAFAQCYVTNEFPVKMEGGADLAVYQDFLSKPPGLTMSTGHGAAVRRHAAGGAVADAQDGQPRLRRGARGQRRAGAQLGRDEGHEPRGCVRPARHHARVEEAQRRGLVSHAVHLAARAQPFEVGGRSVKEELGGMHGVADSK